MLKEYELEEYERFAYQKGRDIALLLDSSVNGCDDKFLAQGLIDQITQMTHRTLQQKIAKLFLKTFEEWAKIGDKGQDYFDARNEDTIRVAKIIREATKNQCIRYI